MNIEIPPAQNSPKHILNVLNDDCIESIFRRLKNLQDFLSAAETCTRFQENAILTFPKLFENIRIGKLCDEPLKKRLFRCNRYTVTMNQAESFLSTFGHLITKLEFDRREKNKEFDFDIQNMITNYCGATLSTFLIRSHSSSTCFCAGASLKALTELELTNTDISGFGYRSQLKKLIVKGFDVSDFTWLIQAFPKLETIQFVELCHLQENHVVEFLKLNPQLKGLNFTFCLRIRPNFLKKIACFAPNLEKLGFATYDKIGQSDWMHISKLRHLKSLFIQAEKCRNDIPIETLFDTLINESIPIEILGVVCSRTRHSTHYLNISQKEMCLTEMSDDSFIDCVKKLPTFEEIILSLWLKVTIKSVQRELRYGNELSVFTVSGNDVCYKYLTEIYD